MNNTNMCEKRYELYENALPVLREMCLSYINTFPPHVVELVRRIPFDDLIGCRKYLGEYYSFWLGETLSIPDQEILLDAGLASFLGRSYVVIQDLLIDDYKNHDPNLIFSIGLFLASSIEEYLSIVPAPSKFLQSFHGLLSTFIEANIVDQRKHRHLLSPFDDTAILELGEKTCVANCTVVALSLFAEKEFAIEPISNVINRSIIGLQICEDIMDWEEDLIRENHTLPVTLSIQMFIKDCPQLADELLEAPATFVNDLRQQIYHPDTLEQLLHEANKHFSIAINDLSQFSSSPIDDHLRAAIKRNNNLLEVLRNMLVRADNVSRYSAEAKTIVDTTLKQNFGKP